MLSLLSVATLVASTSFSQVINEDDVTLIRANTGNKSRPLSVWRYTNDGPGGDFVGSLTGSDLKIKAAQAGGSKPVRWSFPADWDGDGTDEFVVIRELTKKKDKRLELRVYPSPESIFDSVDKILAKSKGADFGVAKGEGKVVAAGAIDLDGDGQDEVAIVREHTWGARFLEIRNLPAGKKSQMGNPIASDLEFGGQAGLQEIISMWSADVDDGGGEELLLIIRGVAGFDRLNAYAAPMTLFADTGTPVASFTDANAPGNFENVAGGRIFLKENGPISSGVTYIALAQVDPSTGDQRVAIHDMPALPNSGALLPPVVVDATPGFNDPKFPIVSVFGTRDNPPPPPPPPPQINGTYTVSFDAEDISGSQVTIGPFLGTSATVGMDATGAFEWNLTMQPGDTAILCPVQGEIVDGAIISIPAATPGPYYTFLVGTAVGIAVVGDTITWPGMDVGVSAATETTPTTIVGADGNCTPGSNPVSCGALTAADGVTVKAWIKGVSFTKQ